MLQNRYYDFINITIYTITVQQAYQVHNNIYHRVDINHKAKCKLLIWIKKCFDKYVYKGGREFNVTSKMLTDSDIENKL